MATSAKTARKPNAAFMKPLTPSAELAAVIGPQAVPRTEVTKKIWEYIKKNNLQDAKNRRNINADDKLRPLFGKDQVSLFELPRLVNAPLTYPAPAGCLGAGAPNTKNAGPGAGVCMGGLPPGRRYSCPAGARPSASASQPRMMRYTTQIVVASTPSQPMKMSVAMALSAIHSKAHQNVDSSQSKCLA